MGKGMSPLRDGGVADNGNHPPLIQIRTPPVSPVQTCAPSEADESHGPVFSLKRSLV